MVKINFKTSTPLSEEHRPEQVPPKAKETPEMEREKEDQLRETEETIVQIEEQAEQQPEAEIQLEESDTVEEPPKKGKAEMRYREAGSADFTGEPPEKWGDEATGGFKKFLTAAAVIIILAAVIFGLYQFTDIFKNLPFLKEKSSAPATPVDIGPTTEPATHPFTEIFQTNAGINTFLNSGLKKIFSLPNANIRFALLVMTPGEMDLTVLADGNDKIAQFKNDLNQAFPALNFKTVSTQVKTVNLNRVVFADLTTKIPETVISPSTQTVSRPAPSPDISSQIKALTQKYKLNLEFFKSGMTRDAGEYQQKNLYIHINGNRDGILNFVQDLATSYPAARFSKLALNPSNLSTYSDKYLSARINLLYINPK